ncbi:protein TORNADO [Trifolium repens]|nr:protein TORNADO [Trifolium repens]
MVVSLAGFAGACYRNTFLLRFYLVVMFLIIAVLIGFIIFANVVTDKGEGRRLINRGYLDYYLDDYSGWLDERVKSDEYWGKISSCIRDSKTCRKLARNFNGVPETSDMFFQRKLAPIQSGCCKPPTDCGYIYQNDTVWIQGAGLMRNNPDCIKWNNDQQQLCYDCDSCKAGVLGSLKKSWRKVSVINIVVMIILVIVYIIAYYAYRNNKRMDNDEPYGEARMAKSQPSAFHL